MISILFLLVFLPLIFHSSIQGRRRKKLLVLHPFWILGFIHFCSFSDQFIIIPFILSNNISAIESGKCLPSPFLFRKLKWKKNGRVLKQSYVSSAFFSFSPCHYHLLLVQVNANTSRSTPHEHTT